MVTIKSYNLWRDRVVKSQQDRRSERSRQIPSETAAASNPLR